MPDNESNHLGMSDEELRDFFQERAKDLAMGDNLLGRGAKRYLDLMSREKRLKRARMAAVKDALGSTPLAGIRDFRFPLCVADCDSLTIVRAEGLLLKKVPIAIDRDGSGGHRGFPLHEVMLRLREQGYPGVTEIQVLDWYEQATRSHPDRLREHPEKRLAKIPLLLDRLEIMRRRMEQHILPALVQEFNEEFDAKRRFTVIVPIRAFRAAIGRVERMAQHELLDAQAYADAVVRVRSLAQGDRAGAWLQFGDTRVGIPEAMVIGGGNAIVYLHTLNTMAEGAKQPEPDTNVILAFGPEDFTVAYGRPGEVPVQSTYYYARMEPATGEESEE
jgi:hypothetical protein